MLVNLAKLMMVVGGLVLAAGSTAFFVCASRSATLKQMQRDLREIVGQISLQGEG